MLAIALSIIIIIAHSFGTNVVWAQTEPSSQLYYTYYDQKIPLTVREDAIAVEFKRSETTRELVRGEENTPLYLQLQQALQGGDTRSSNASTPVQVKPLGRRYALIKFAEVTRGVSTNIEQQAAQQTYVESTLPVVKRSDRNEYLVVPNEIVVSFDSKLSSDEVQGIIQRSNLRVVRPLRFSRNRYLVRSSSVVGTAVLGIANQLNQTSGIKSATPNFIQSPPQQISKSPENKNNSAKISKITQKVTIKPNNTRSAEDTSSFQTQLSWLQWHLDSRPIETLFVCAREYPTEQEKVIECINNPPQIALPPRADLHATEAWQQGNGGDGAVVAVLDSIIQWDHPDLAGNIYAIGNVPDKLPGENYGWDFADNDADTRISDAELSLYSPVFQTSFTLSDADLLQQAPELMTLIRESYPNSSDRDIASLMRESIQGTITSLFHGTMVSGVIAARSPDGTGLIGVAPNAKILPVSIGRDSFAPDAVIEGIGYAAARGADVINMSFAFPSFAPIQDMADTILEIEQQHPDLVLVAAAGNEASDEISFPANMKGVISVGATSVTRNLASYSNFGDRIDIVAPGGDLSIQALGKVGGILTTGGTWVQGFWQGMPSQPGGWGEAFDPKGQYLWTEGTSFASPAVAGVVALMKGEDPQRQVDRDRLIAILLETASDKELIVTEQEMSFYNSVRQKTQLPSSMTSKQYFFGRGLVNAALAVEKVKRSRL